MIFDRYLITAIHKTTGATTVLDEVTLFGLYMYIFTSGLMPDPTKGQGRMVYYKKHKGIMTKVLDKFK